MKAFLQTYINPFKPDRIKDSVLENLVRQGAEVLNIESDSKTFTHLTDQNAILVMPKAQTKPKAKTQENELISAN